MCKQTTYLVLLRLFGGRGNTCDQKPNYHNFKISWDSVSNRTRRFSNCKSGFKLPTDFSGNTNNECFHIHFRCISLSLFYLFQSFDCGHAGAPPSIEQLDPGTYSL
ncbi:Hypothetical predicted protein [Octopus vulgaris]|uniref:Uncharacterized protein n=1 Tax=Octopus vulgaris TaxID=6645 RepID=A0AA36BJH5_OCTVU|nr:Hypothetical predicted protein [Octopus vulgaris]